MLQALPEVEVLAPQYEGAILSFFSTRMPSDRIAAELDRRGFCVRAGLHCSPQGHRTLGTLPDGAVRVSHGAYSKLSEADALFLAVRDILK